MNSVQLEAQFRANAVDLLTSLQSLTNVEIAQLAVGLGLTYVFAKFVIKMLTIALLRQFGLYSHSLYRELPSTLPCWRTIYRLKLALSRWREFIFRAPKQATGGFAPVLSVMSEVYKPKQVFLGLPWVYGFKSFQPIGLNLETHMMLVAQSGAGKSVFLLSLLGQWKNSVFAIDPKGELNQRLAHARARKNTVVTLAPYHPERSGQVNPFDCLHEAYETHGESVAIQWAYRIGHAFIEDDPHSRNKFYTGGSRGFLVGLILFVYVSFSEKNRHLGTVRDLIVRGLAAYNDDGSVESTDAEENHKRLHESMLACPRFNEAIAGAASPYINASPETFGNLQATLQEKTKVLDIPSIRYMLSATTRPLRDLKRCDDYWLFFEATPSSLKGELKDLARLLTNLVIYTMESEPKKNGQCLIVAEELNAQGYNPALESALPVLRSMGGSFIGVTQDVAALKAEYPDTYLSFFGNSDATVWMSSPHPDNLKLLSEMLGKKTHVATDPKTGNKSYRETSVLEPEQIARFLNKDSQNMIVTRAGKRALRLKLDPYYKALPVTSYTSDPDHREPLLRLLSRLLFNPTSLWRKA